VIHINKAKTITNNQADETYRVLPTKQDKLLFALTRETGLRISDALNLKNIDVENPLRVWESKTQKIRKILLSDWLFRELQERVEYNTTSNFVFRSPRNNKKPMHRSTYHRHLKKAATFTHVDLSAHSNRKLYAKNIFSETKDIFAVQKALGHKYISTTATYLDIDLNRLITAAAEPPAPPKQNFLQKIVSRVTINVLTFVNTIRYNKRR
jgi:integrase